MQREFGGYLPLELPHGQELWFVIVVQFDQLTSPVP
jgi:hypothetical protein